MYLFNSLVCHIGYDSNRICGSDDPLRWPLNRSSWRKNKRNIRVSICHLMLEASLMIHPLHFMKKTLYFWFTQPCYLSSSPLWNVWNIPDTTCSPDTLQHPDFLKLMWRRRVFKLRKTEKEEFKCTTLLFLLLISTKSQKIIRLASCHWLVALVS